MKFLDLLKMSISNLGRRKVRTSLTTLGVLIGTTSVVSMISLGIGLQDMMTHSFSQYSSLTAIEVRAHITKEKESKTKVKYIDDKLIKELSKIEHVDNVSPTLSASVLLMQGVWQAQTQIIGVSNEYMKDMKFKYGGIPTGKNMEYIIGNQVITEFSNKKTGKGYYDDNVLPNVDFENKPLFTIFEVDKYYQSISNDSETKTRPPKKYIVKTSGVIKGDIEDYNQYSFNIYTNIETLKTRLKKIYKKNLIPGQPTSKKNKPLKFWVYDSLIVNVDDMKNVLEVQKKINDMGFQASSSMEWLEQSKQQSKMVQAVLGGIGAISLFVAAIGIANTMMMSIYERTKEIGIMKVLGCDMKRIRDMFLIESGFIGFLGGVIGLVFSYIIAFIINSSPLVDTMGEGAGGRLSIIPLWLAVISIIFAIMIGMLAGFFPAIRAMNLSPLQALRND